MKAPSTKITRDNSHSGEIIRLMRQTRGIAQSDVSTLLQLQNVRHFGVSQISRYETGQSRMTVELATLFCRLYGFHPVTLALCELKNDPVWWRCILALDPGRFFETILTSSYHIYGETISDLEDEDFHVASSLILALFDARLSPRRRKNNKYDEIINS
ncbi:helix-turn-helix transcriptional regulator [Parvularcula sp. IMCC14364]|uniref:helix-turn-helix domain-containing protein n=1 Tax=Parvularcula sp. IMCC14364 TaxID=3067902 RepID=UPI0027409350|nr:helix-turn-helix transcriptional regulator [Parvularcula sp. IMCC14364]